MEKLLNEFVVHRPIEQAWAVLTDIERIAPCLPGAELHEIDGDVYKGVVKVKLGAIATAFKGQAHFVERDDANHRAVLNGEGRDTTGKGNASALITARLDPVTDDTSKCVVETELHITGKVAQFGRGIMGDVSKKLMNQFASNLNTMLDEQGPDEQGPDETGPDGESAPAAPAAGDTPGDSATAQAAPVGANEPAGPRRVTGPAAEPIQLTDVAGTAVLKRLLPLVGGLVLLLLIVRRWRRGGR